MAVASRSSDVVGTRLDAGIAVDVTGGRLNAEIAMDVVS